MKEIKVKEKSYLIFQREYSYQDWERVASCQEFTASSKEEALAIATKMVAGSDDKVLATIRGDFNGDDGEFFLSGKNPHYRVVDTDDVIKHLKTLCSRPYTQVRKILSRNGKM